MRMRTCSGCAHGARAHWRVPTPCSALAEARIPPGPRLVILHHLEMYRNPSAYLKPAMPLPPMPPMPQPQALQQQPQALQQRGQ